MQFTVRKRRQPPAVIIISLIDILIVLLIFLMVTTTFKQRPALKLVLPESKQAVRGTTDEGIVVTINKTEPVFFLSGSAVTLERLQENLKKAASTNASAAVIIYADEPPECKVRSK